MLQIDAIPESLVIGFVAATGSWAPLVLTFCVSTLLPILPQQQPL